jgi:translocation and assembly module TamB
VADISWLARGVPMIRRLGGEVEGSLALSGPAAKPDFVAELSLADGEFRAETTMPVLRDLQVQVGIAQRTATIKQFSGSIGGSPFKLEGSVRLPEDGEPEADLRVQGANLLLYRSEAVGVRGDADLTIRGTFAAPVFAGTFAITDGRLRKNINWLEPLRGIGQTRASVAGTAGPGGLGISFHNPPLRDATFDIRVTSKNPFQVKSNVARGNLRPDLRLRGNGEIPLLTGVIYIDRSRILLPAGRLAVEAGLIRFPENSPNRPLLEISGASRILGYDINLTVEGPYDEPTVSLSSVPPLPQDALLLLLLTGRLPPGEVEQNRGWQEGMKVALYVGKGVLEEWFGGNDLDSEESLLERFDIVTGRGISRQGNETIGAQYRLADDVVRDGDELYLVAERDIYDEFNAGIRIVFRFK